MFTLILFVILALIFSYFSSQNTQIISITLANYTITGIPLYIAIGTTLLIGLLFSWVISLVDSFLVSMKLRGKDNTIKDSKKTIQSLTKRVNELEIENATLKGKKGQENNESL